jgi:hypothetical protein
VRVVSLASDLDRRSTIGPGFTRAMTGVMGMVGAHFPGSAETARHYLVGVRGGGRSYRLPRRKERNIWNPRGARSVSAKEPRRDAAVVTSVTPQMTVCVSVLHRR